MIDLKKLETTEFYNHRYRNFSTVIIVPTAIPLCSVVAFSDLRQARGDRFNSGGNCAGQNGGHGSRDGGESNCDESYEGRQACQTRRHAAGVSRCCSSCTIESA